MTLSAQDALIHLMVIAAASDAAISSAEYERIHALVQRTPIFSDFDVARLEAVANAAVDAINSAGVEAALDAAISAVPLRLQDTAYALAVEIAVVDLRLPQEELRLLEMIRDRLQIDRLVTAAIEAAARARMRTPHNGE
ncbi:MAG TPA: tellurite resistance TerB family protein [Alphaproteobacteria bacterium]|nr:tellurite resistance TerB family protein [Alphaproteobacteria bacterium]